MQLKVIADSQTEIHFAEEGPLYDSGERKLLCAIIARTIFDIEQYLHLEAPKRHPLAYQVAKEAFNYVHASAKYSAYPETPFSFNYVMEHLFKTKNATQAQKIRRYYSYLPPPYQAHPDDSNRNKRSYRSQIVRRNTVRF